VDLLVWRLFDGCCRIAPELPWAFPTYNKRKEKERQMGQSNQTTLKALILYYSATGNTKKVAHAIHSGLVSEKAESTLLATRDATDKDLYDYDLVFLGSPSIQFLPAEPVMRFIKDKMKLHMERGDIKLCAPKIPGKAAVVFCTYSGPHTGLNEAVTTGKYMGQFFEHLGFDVVGEWYVVGEFHNWEEANKMGRLGDIRGRPSEEDLLKVRSDVSSLVRSILDRPR
jgi:flavodoxin